MANMADTFDRRTLRLAHENARLNEAKIKQFITAGMREMMGELRRLYAENVSMCSPPGTEFNDEIYNRELKVMAGKSLEWCRKRYAAQVSANRWFDEQSRHHKKHLRNLTKEVQLRKEIQKLKAQIRRRKARVIALQAEQERMMI